MWFLNINCDKYVYLEKIFGGGGPSSLDKEGKKTTEGMAGSIQTSQRNVVELSIPYTCK